MDTSSEAPESSFPTAAWIFFGLDLGGFFDDIVLHQVLQWHHMATSAVFPADTVAGLRWNTLFDGLFHATTYAFALIGLILPWRSARRTHLRCSSRLFAGTALMGSGLSNLPEGTVSYHLLGLHDVSETVPRHQWIWWNPGFLAWGAVMPNGGHWLWRRVPAGL